MWYKIILLVGLAMLASGCLNDGYYGDGDQGYEITSYRHGQSGGGGAGGAYNTDYGGYYDGGYYDGGYYAGGYYAGGYDDGGYAYGGGYSSDPYFYTSVGTYWGYSRPYRYGTYPGAYASYGYYSRPYGYATRPYGYDAGRYNYYAPYRYGRYGYAGRRETQYRDANDRGGDYRGGDGAAGELVNRVRDRDQQRGYNRSYNAGIGRDDARVIDRGQGAGSAGQQNVGTRRPYEDTGRVRNRDQQNRSTDVPARSRSSSQAKPSYPTNTSRDVNAARMARERTGSPRPAPEPGRPRNSRGS